MKKFALVLLLTVIGAIGANAQKFALVDMEYILRNVPSYEMASEQLNQLSQRWQREIENIGTEAQTMYQSYLADKVFLTDDQAKAREQEIANKEKEATELRMRYFPKVNCTRNSRHCCAPSRTMCTMPLNAWPRNAATRPCSTERRPRK